jgi:hypothetical protein
MPTEKSIAEKFEALKTTMSKSTYERSVQPEVDKFNADPEAYVEKIKEQKEQADREDAADQTA